MTRRFLGGMLVIASMVAGSMSAHAASGRPVDGFGRDIPISFAVKQIVPSDYDVSFGGDVDTRLLVSWEGGGDWQTVLGNVLSAKGLTYNVSGKTIRVTRTAGGVAGASAFDASGPRTPGMVLVPYAKPGPQQKVEVATAPVSQPAPVSQTLQTPASPQVTENGRPVEGKVPSKTAQTGKNDKSKQQAINLADKPDVTISSSVSWKVPAGGTLRDILTDWCEAGGWTLVWNSDYEYPIQAGASFDGDFITATSALVKSLAEAKPPVKASFYRGNKVLLISTSIEEQN
jgi:hypothetical protein